MKLCTCLLWAGGIYSDCYPGSFHKKQYYCINYSIFFTWLSTWQCESKKLHRFLSLLWFGWFGGGAYEYILDLPLHILPLLSREKKLEMLHKISADFPAPSQLSITLTTFLHPHNFPPPSQLSSTLTTCLQPHTVGDCDKFCF